MSAQPRTRELAIAELARLATACRQVSDSMIQMEMSALSELRYLRSKAQTPKSHKQFQGELADRVRRLDDLITTWNEATKPALENSPLKVAVLMPGGKG